MLTPPETRLTPQIQNTLASTLIVYNGVRVSLEYSAVAARRRGHKIHIHVSRYI